MKITGELALRAPREAVFDRIQDARFFASCIDGVQELTEIDPMLFDATFETKVAYMKFSFRLTVAVTRRDPPSDIETTIEGKPLGIVGRLSATSKTHLTQVGADTKIAYEIDAVLTGKLGGIGQPVLRAKAKEMEKQFTARLTEAFAEPAGCNPR